MWTKVQGTISESTIPKTPQEGNQSKSLKYPCRFSKWGMQPSIWIRFLLWYPFAIYVVLTFVKISAKVSLATDDYGYLFRVRPCHSKWRLGPHEICGVLSRYWSLFMKHMVKLWELCTSLPSITLLKMRTTVVDHIWQWLRCNMMKTWRCHSVSIECRTAIRNHRRWIASQWIVITELHLNVREG